MKRIASQRVVALLVYLGTVVVMRSQQPSTQRFPQFENVDVKVWKSVVYPDAPLTMHRHDHPRVIIALEAAR
jgi:beta-alanine degradation protein BauB